MNEAIMIALGVLSTGIVLFLTKFFGGTKGDAMTPVSSPKVTEALETASELLGQRAMIEAQAEEDRKRVEDALAIKDPVKRVEALAEELKDL